MDTYTENEFQELIKELTLPSYLEYETEGRYKAKLVEMPKNLKPRPIRKYKNRKKEQKMAPNWEKAKHAMHEFMHGFVLTGLILLNVSVMAVGLFFFGFLFTIVPPDEVVSLYNETAIEIMEENSLLPSTEWVGFDRAPEAIAVTE